MIKFHGSLCCYTGRPAKEQQTGLSATNLAIVYEINNNYEFNVGQKHSLQTIYPPKLMNVVNLISALCITHKLKLTD